MTILNYWNVLYKVNVIFDAKARRVKFDSDFRKVTSFL